MMPPCHSEIQSTEENSFPTSLLDTFAEFILSLRRAQYDNYE